MADYDCKMAGCENCDSELGDARYRETAWLLFQSHAVQSSERIDLMMDEHVDPEVEQHMSLRPQHHQGMLQCTSKKHQHHNDIDVQYGMKEGFDGQHYNSTIHNCSSNTPEIPRPSAFVCKGKLGNFRQRPGHEVSNGSDSSG